MNKNYVIAVSTVSQVNGSHQLKLFNQDSETDFNSSVTTPYLVVRDMPSFKRVLAETFLYRPAAPNAHYKYGEEVFEGVENPSFKCIRLKFNEDAYPPAVEVVRLGESVRLSDGETAIPYLLIPNWLDLGVINRKVTLLPMHYSRNLDLAPDKVVDQLLTLMAAQHISVAVR